MKEKESSRPTQEAEYLLEYGRRKIRMCADTFKDLAGVFEQSSSEEGKDIPEKADEREDYFLRRQLKGTRCLLADNLREMAGIMDHVAADKIEFIRMGGRRQKQMVKAMNGEGLTVSDLYFIKRQGERLLISLSVGVKKKDKSVTVEEIAGYLSVLLNMRLMPGHRNPYFVGNTPAQLYFEEEPSYCYMTGTARAVKEGEQVSGDTFSFYEGDEGILTAILSDGMGSGEKALKDSEAIVENMERFLEAGLPVSTGIQALNSMMAAQEPDENMSTLDVCRFDLYEGNASFYKVGAACSFLKHGVYVEKIQSDTLPLGVFSRIEAKPVERTLSDGDMIIIVSDGVMEHWPEGDGESALLDFIGRTDTDSPVDMANRILRFVIEKCQGHIRDDMTVLAVGIWENQLEDND